ncbi:hypothetical protein HDV00_008846 [Rhizophlyctis rosea]|nr:hypothetical protein HDV00_008846 [Rhizophlyctis rosea]
MPSVRLLSRAAGSLATPTTTTHLKQLPALSHFTITTQRISSSRLPLSPSSLTSSYLPQTRFFTGGSASFNPPPNSKPTDSFNPQTASKDGKQPTKDQPDVEEDGAQGLDLFATLKAQQKREEAAAAAGTSPSTAAGPSSAGGAGFGDVEEGQEQLSPEEAEKLRQFKKKQEEEELAAMKKSWRNLGAFSAAFFVLGYIYLGLPGEEDRAASAEEKQAQQNASFLTTYNQRVWKNLKAVRDVSIGCEWVGRLSRERTVRL